MESEISIKDKKWFLYNKGELSLNQKKKLSLKLAWGVLPIYENKYPNDSRVKDCLQAIEDFYNNKISIDILIAKKNAAYAATYGTYAATYADTYATYAANYATYATTYAAYAAYAVDATTYAATYAAADAAIYAAAYAANNSISYSDKLKIIMIDFINNND